MYGLYYTSFQGCGKEHAWIAVCNTWGLVLLEVGRRGGSAG